jgi:hypothetical protein
MQRTEFIRYLSQDNKFGYKSKEKHIKNAFPVLYDEIILYNDKNFPYVSWKQKLHNFINKINTPMKCRNEECRNNVKFHPNPPRYHDYCSNHCAQASKEVIEKKKNTTLKNIGVSYPSQSKEVKEKIKKTLLKNYDVDNPSKCEAILKTKKETSLKRYGFDNFSKTDSFKKRMDEYYNESVIDNFSKRLKTDKNNIKIIDNENLEIFNYCNKHSSFIISKDNIYNRINLKIENICTKCNPISLYVSNKEFEIKKYIEEELNIKTKKIKLKEINPDIDSGYEIDVYIPEHKLGIEHNGIFYHSDKFKTNDYHLKKTKKCAEVGIDLIHIFEDEWINKKGIVKSLIKNKLNLINNKLYARKCKIKEIDNKLYKQFLDDNHIQGYATAKIKIGLFYEDELVSVISFGKQRLVMGYKNNKDNEYELIRFCNKLNTVVIGGFSKLLKYFIKTYKPNYIVTYANRRFYKGNIYLNNGFTFIGETKPNYFYSHKHTYKRYYRFNFRKDKLIKEGYDPNKTEKEIMSERGYMKIYDCGQLKFELII